MDILKTYRIPEEIAAKIERLKPAYGSLGKVIVAGIECLDSKPPSKAAQDATQLRKQAQALGRASQTRELEVEYD